MRALFRQPDPLLFSLALAATILGAIMIFDAGYARSLQSGAGAIPREFRSQAIFIVVALLAGLLATVIPNIAWKRLSVALFFLSLAALVAVEVFGKEMNGAKRWIDLGPIVFQPAELVKLTAILYLAAAFAARKARAPREKLRNWGEWLDKRGVPLIRRALPILWVVIAVVLISIEPDLGTASVVAVTLFAMMVLGGVSRKSLVLFALVGCIGIAVMTIQEPYRMERIVNHSQRWDEANRDDIGFQTTTSETAIAAGGLAGVGIGSGRAKHLMPAATTDFILTTVAEEFGLLGVLAVLSLIGAIVLRLVVLGGRAAGLFPQLVLFGTASWIGVQTCVNVMMSNGTLPAIGIPLPFFSSGGSSLVAIWIAVGICQSAAVQRAREEERLEDRRHGRWNRRPRLSRA